MLRTRAISALVLVPPLLIALALGTAALTVVLVIVAALGASEAFRLLKGAGFSSLPVFGTALAVAFVLEAYWRPFGDTGLLLVAIGTVLARIGAFARLDPRDGLRGRVRRPDRQRPPRRGHRTGRARRGPAVLARWGARVGAPARPRRLELRHRGVPRGAPGRTPQVPDPHLPVEVDRGSDRRDRRDNRHHGAPPRGSRAAAAGRARPRSVARDRRTGGRPR